MNQTYALVTRAPSGWRVEYIRMYRCAVERLETGTFGRSHDALEYLRGIREVDAGVVIRVSFAPH